MMKRIPALLLAAGAALAAPAFAQTAYPYPPTERVVTQVYDPVTGVTTERTTVYYPEGVVNYDRPLSSTSSTSSTSTTVIYDSPTTEIFVDPAPVTVVEPIIINAPRGSRDVLITNDVADRIADNPTINGQIGIETHRGQVELSGKVTTPGMAERAEREAKSVDGVRDVTSTIRSRVGG